MQLSPGTAVGACRLLLASRSSLDDATLTVVDNHRVLHGRSAFNGKRRMCGAYIGVDEYRSKLAVLTDKFAERTSAEDATPMPDDNRSIWNPYL